MNIRVVLLGLVAVLGGCNQGPETNQTANAAAKATAAKPKHPTYCFFKDADTKGWTATRDASGNVTVKGRAHIEDNRYAAQLDQPEISGSNASLWLTMGPNSGAYAAPENTWDVKAAIPNSSAIQTVTIMCGTKTVAELNVSAAG